MNVFVFLLFYASDIYSISVSWQILNNCCVSKPILQEWHKTVWIQQFYVPRPNYNMTKIQTQPPHAVSTRASLASCPRSSHSCPVTHGQRPAVMRVAWHWPTAAGRSILQPQSATVLSQSQLLKSGTYYFNYQYNACSCNTTFVLNKDFRFYDY